VHFVFDLVQGSDLFDYLVHCDGYHLSEQQSAIFFSQMLDAMIYLNNERIVHRDIKLENFLVNESEGSIKIKLIDFGFAIKLKEEEMTKGDIGTYAYMAPEIMDNLEYDMRADMWSLGIVLFNMVTGKQPFKCESKEEIYDQIKNEMFLFEPLENNNDLKDLIKCLLCKDPSKRMTPFEAKNHKYIQLIQVGGK
jgi:serine/threonine protein kinase